MNKNILSQAAYHNAFIVQKESKDHFHWQSRVQALSKTPIQITEAVYTVKLISYLQTNLHVIVSN